MTVTEETRQKLYQRAGGYCECRMRICSHHKPFLGLFRQRCPHRLTHGWEAHHRRRNGPDNLGNLTAMCATCHKNTRTHGRE